MVNQELRNIINQIAPKYGLDPDLVEAHVMTESSGNPQATRWEPQFYERYVRPLGLSDQNEARGRAMSFGLLQIMGQVAREMGYRGPFADLLNPEIGLEWGCRKLAKCYLKYETPDSMDAGIAAYNSGSPRRKPDGTFVNQVYVDRVNGYLKRIRSGK